MVICKGFFIFLIFVVVKILLFRKIYKVLGFGEWIIFFLALEDCFGDLFFLVYGKVEIKC